MSINPLNGASSTLRAPLGISGSALAVQLGQGARFNIPSGDHIYITVSDSTGFEIVRYDSVGVITGDNIPISRSQDGTGARAFPIGATVRAAWNLAQLAEYVLELAVTLIPPSPSSSPVYFGTGVPPGALIATFPLYYDTATGTFYAWNGSAYIPLVTNDQMFSSAGAPSPTGATPGVMYYETDNGTLWLKIAGVWTVVSISDLALTAGAGVPGGGTDGFLYRDTATGIVYVKIAGVWYPTQTTAILPDIYGAAQTVETGEVLTLDQQGRVTAHSAAGGGPEYLVRTAAVGAPTAVPVLVAFPGFAGPQPALATVSGIHPTVLSAVGTTVIRVTPPVGKKAYVRLTASCALVPTAALAGTRVALLSIKKSTGGYIEPDPVVATNTPVQSVYWGAGDVQAQFINVESQVIEVAAATDFASEIAAQTAEFQTATTAFYGGVSFGCELLYVR